MEDPPSSVSEAEQSFKQFQEPSINHLINYFIHHYGEGKLARLNFS